MAETQKDEKAIKDVGPALNLSAQDIALLSNITEQDILEAQRWAEEHGTPIFVGLVNAETWPPDEVD